MGMIGHVWVNGTKRRSWRGQRTGKSKGVARRQRWHRKGSGSKVTYFVIWINMDLRYMIVGPSFFSSSQSFVIYTFKSLQQLHLDVKQHGHISMYEKNFDLYVISDFHAKQGNCKTMFNSILISGTQKIERYKLKKVVPTCNQKTSGCQCHLLGSGLASSNHAKVPLHLLICLLSACSTRP